MNFSAASCKCWYPSSERSGADTFFVGGMRGVLQLVLSPPNLKIFMGTCTECMIMAHDSS